jgi:hypothetical protein
MKALLTLFFPLLAFGHYRPELLARYGVGDSWNAPPNMFCFSSEPLVTPTAVYLGCMDQQGGLGMVAWAPDFQVAGVAREGRYFSLPKFSLGRVYWSEFEEWGSRRFFVQSSQGMQVTELGRLAPAGIPDDSFLPLTEKSWIYRLKDYASPALWLWEEHQTRPLFNRPVSHIFPPIVGENGELVIKTREQHNHESAPDKLWAWDGKSWQIILEDRDSNPSSPWISFRHQISVEGSRVLLVARDARGDALILLENGKVTEVARAGEKLREFDFFTPKLRGDVIAFRGVDIQGRKGIWTHTPSGLRPLITQGELIQTDLGPARVDYPSIHAIFYGPPAIGPGGEIVQQATLTAPDNLRKLLGIGLLKFSPEQK